MPRQLTAEDLYRLQQAEDPQISPDGSRIAYVVTAVDRASYEYRRTIWVVETASGAARQYTSGPNDSAPAWSPGGTHLAFVRGAAKPVKPKAAEERERGVGRPQLFLLPADGGEARQLTWHRQGAGNPVWSPDGAMLAYVAATGTADDTEAEDAALDGRNVPAVRTIRQLWYRADGEGWHYEHRRHIFLIKPDEGEPRQLTDGDWDDAFPAWSPDGRRIAFTSDRTADRWRVLGSDVWTVDIASGALDRVTDESLHCGAAAWSPDGARLAFAASPRVERGGHVDMYVAPASGKPAARAITLDQVPTWSDTCIDDMRAGHGPSLPFWSADGHEIICTASARGVTHVYALPGDGGAPRALTSGACHVTGFSLDATRQALALTITHPTMPAEVYTLPADGSAEPRVLTNLTERLRAEVALAQPEEFAFSGADGWELQGWVMRPPQVADGARVPAVLQVHGGPHMMYGWSFFFEFQLLAARGYAVIYTNPRGSTGYGREFSRAVTNDWGGKDYVDIMAGLDAAIAQGGIDADRLGVAGGSYGGYMTNWIIGHSDRFQAAVTMRCVSNLMVLFGASDVGWQISQNHFDATPWDGQAFLLERSPITYVGNIHTPLLILHSDNDLRCPIAEGEQMFTALKYLGREVEMVRFEGQTHDLSRNGHPRSRVLRLQHIERWFERYIPAGANAR
jgi:dipeptidyl aminopeptidase/acylaminoacyl peptidase